VVSNLLWPHFLHSKAFLLLAVALIGTTITPYMQFYLTSAVVDKGVTPKTYKGERIDTINGGHPVRRGIDLHHHRHGGRDRRHRAAEQHRTGRGRAAPGRRRRGVAAVRHRAARRRAAGGDGGAAVDRVRDRRDRRRRALAVP
jgi:Natural resistance-associated macrophage protein